ncbi:hypothetical protein SOASR030_16470 [Leminorella grimontii]|uniref:PilN domain-containing protein n=1 Tax=Leminorella grimontii TaxID=82981 RepID=A0AAV5N1W8_9GAMM|nr:PilN domain-containing protein [Leminorella grimontii]KFC93767.1 hypothetical protein GLGR_3332 [Leminorella grimontii ATCC 33999 = DSM 5078]GKX55535.1 hypothetical protein SOASR030_16470 [Leminorella grimontii]VFS55664.1 Uncharacterised protein [Leminorella grimontii]
MLQVNFLPWRERQRKRASKCFAALVAVYAAGAVVAIASAYGFQQYRYRADIEALRAIEEADAMIQARIAQAAVLQARFASLSATVEQIERYRQSTGDVSRRFLTIETTLPEALWLKRVTYQDDAFTILGQGWAEGDVVEYLQNLGASLTGWRLRLTEMVGAAGASGGQVTFILDGQRKEALP